MKRAVSPWIIVTAPLLILALCCAQASSPPADILPYRTTTEEARVNTITTQLRCVQCQNQSVAESQAPIAQLMRKQTLYLVQAGWSDTQIRQYFVKRYGDVISYRPPFDSRTWLLWLGPFLPLLAGIRWWAHRLSKPPHPTPSGPT